MESLFTAYAEIKLDQEAEGCHVITIFLLRMQGENRLIRNKNIYHRDIFYCVCRVITRGLRAFRAFASAFLLLMQSVNRESVGRAGPLEHFLLHMQSVNM